jgi:DNA-binding transcriptional ArsR family regulator
MHAPVFAALGDPTRLALVSTLSRGDSHSISQLTEGSRLTRQAITKHLRVLEHAGVVRCVRQGRESLFEFEPQPLQAAMGYLASVSEQWDQALGRLKSFVEQGAF